MTWKRPNHADASGRDRGVSDVVAFVFVFSIIITSVGLVSAVGFTALEDLRSNEQAINAERGFQSLGYNLGNVQRGHAPGRTGELKLSGGQIRVVDGAQINVDVDATNTSSTNSVGIDRTLDMNTLLYQMESRKTNVSYESGAVMRSDRGNSVLVEQPQFICKDFNNDGNDKADYAMISIVKLQSDEPTLGGDGTVQIIGREERSELLFASNESVDVDEIEIEVTDSSYENAWEDFFTGKSGWTNLDGDSAYECDLEPDARVYVRYTVIDIEFVT